MAGSDLPTAARVTIACYGDSITSGTGTAPGDATKNTGYRYPLYSLLTAGGVRPFFTGTQAVGDADAPQIMNDGVAGETTPQITTRIVAGQSARQAEIVLIHAGTNDIQIGTPDATIGALLNTAVTDAWEYGQRAGANRTKLVVIAQICDIWTQAAHVLAVNALIPAIVAAHVAAGRNVKMVDMYTALGGGQGANFNQASFPHPSVAGYEIMAGIWAGAAGSGLLIDWTRS